jgi:hypothetical protein
MLTPAPATPQMPSNAVQISAHIETATVALNDHTAA